MVTLVHYVEFIHIDLSRMVTDPKLTTQRVENREKEVYLPSGAIGYRFFSQSEMVIDGERLKGERKEYSDFYYMGKMYELNKLKEEFPGVVDDMGMKLLEATGITKVVRTPEGAIVPLRSGDKILPPQ